MTNTSTAAMNNQGTRLLRSTPDSLGAGHAAQSGFGVADRLGFEPRTALRLYGISSAAPSTGLGHLSPLGKSTHALTPLPPRATLRRPMRERGSVWRGLLSAPFIAIAVLAPLATAFGLGLFSPGAAHTLAASRVARPPIDNQNHLYVLDGWGGVHPVGASPPLTTTASWPHKDIAQSLALFPDGTGGYVMDCLGPAAPGRDCTGDH